jgi:molecular chaperone GrpE
MSNKRGTSETKSDSELIDEVLEQISEAEKKQTVTEKEAEAEAEIKNMEEERAKPEDESESQPQSTEESNGSLETLQKQLKQAQKEAQDHWERVLRIQADMENLKRRTQKDLENAHKYALEKFAKELLSVIDSLELGIQASTSDNPEVVALREGSELTVKQFEAVFAKFNIEAIDPSGQPFDPELHQAMSMQPTADAEPNTVINVFQKGYCLNGRLIRPAMVVVAAKMPESSASSETNTNIDEQA